MKPAPFILHSPDTLEEALDLLARYGSDARILAGGQSLVPLLNMRMVQPQALISINRCRELAYVRKDQGALAVGALTRQAEAEDDEVVRADCPLLAQALPFLGGMANRNRGTVCGSLAHADPLAELPAVALALDAEFTISSSQGRRTVGAVDFFIAELTTRIDPGEMLEAVTFPAQQAGDRTAFVEVGNRRHGFAVAGVAARVSIATDGTCSGASIAAIGAGPTAVRLPPVEDLLTGSTITDAVLEEAARTASAHVDPMGDLHADADYRRQVIGTLVKRAITAAETREGAREAA